MIDADAPQGISERSVTLPRLTPLAAANNPVARLADPARPVTDATVFDPAASYRIKLRMALTFAGVVLSPMAVHTVAGGIAQSVRDKITAYEPA